MKKIYEIENLQTDGSALLLNETLFHNANGYIGIRSNFEEGYPGGIDTIRGSYINGFYDFAEMKQAEKLCGLTEEKQTILNVADTQGIKLFLDGEEFSMFRGTVFKSRRTLNMSDGYTERYVHWRSPLGKEAEIRVRRLTSFTQPSLFLIEYSLRVCNFSGPVRFVSTHRGDVVNYSSPDDPRVAAESVRRLVPVRAELEQTASFITSETVKSKLRVCTAVDHILTAGGEDSVNPANKTSPGAVIMDAVLDGHGTICTINADIQKNEILTLRKYSIFTDGLRYGDCEKAARQELQKALATDIAAVYEAQKNYLRTYWDRAFLEVDGDDDLEQAVTYNLYQLIQSTGQDEHSSVAAKGLSGEGYEGHFFWDTEMYIEPFFLLTNPDIARQLISYRYITLDEARKNARLLGHSAGALFPWRTIMGRECSGYFPAGSAQYHINGDIAWSVVSYYIATGDLSFIAEKGAEIVFECARLWIDVGNYYQGSFRINEVTGPDEYTCLVNNNYYTNLSAQFNLRWAVKFYELLKTVNTAEGPCGKIGLSPAEIEAFSRAAENMYLPYDGELGINPQDDSFLSKKRWNPDSVPQDHFPLLLHYHPLYLYRHQVCKQADTVLAHFIFEDAQSQETIRNSFHYYEGITTHDSSLSTCVFSIVASGLGFHDKAYRYFGNSAKLDLFNTHGNTKDGIHTANMGGTYMAIVYGFAGLRIKEKGIYFAPSLPAAWEGYCFRIFYQGSQIHVEVNRTELHFTLLSGLEQRIHVYDQAYGLSKFLRITRPQPGILQYRAVIFDLDGVIISTDKYHYRAWESITEELGIPFNEEINNRLRGISRMQSLEIILKSGGLIFPGKEKTILAEKKNALYRRLLEDLSPASVDPDVIATLEEIRVMGIKTAIGSSSKNAKYILEKTGLDAYFDAVSDGTNITRTKPDPEVFLKAAELLGVSPKDALVVEDAAAGIEAAAAGGFASAAIGDARGSFLCTCRINKLSDLLLI
ncbi:MAG: beta-phosphoglucomutase [Spirochaetaceae bacterium]|jgi:alpha,alpha-trehalose phosphorylase|nr:beta-phosphoglucomutase [Spirochaetaceae bacterium]